MSFDRAQWLEVVGGKAVEIVLWMAVAGAIQEGLEQKVDLGVIPGAFVASAVKAENSDHLEEQTGLVGRNSLFLRVDNRRPRVAEVLAAHAAEDLKKVVTELGDETGFASGLRPPLSSAPS